MGGRRSKFDASGFIGAGGPRGMMYPWNARGDPFLGALLPFAAKALPFARAAVGGLTKLFSKGQAGAGAVSAAGGIAGRIMGAVRSPVGRAAVGGAATGAVLGAIGRGGRRGAMDGAGRSYRRMNVANVRALRRACRRVSGFASLAKQTVNLTKDVRLKAPRKRKKC